MSMSGTNLKTISQQMIEIIESSELKDDEKTKKIDEMINGNNRIIQEIVNTLGSTSGLTPLMSACRHVNVDLVSRLIELGADVNKTDRRRNATALIHTFQYIITDSNNTTNYRRSQADIVECLLKNGANPNTRDHFGTTPLMMVDSEPLARMLINAGARVNVKDSMHLSPFMHSLVRRLYDVARLLIEHGADLYEPDFVGKIAIEYFDSTAPLDFKLFFLSKYLEPVCNYFRESDFTTIRSDIDRFIEHSTDNNLFPFKTYHLIAMNILAWDMDNWSGTTKEERILSALDLIDRMRFLAYFSSADFKEKLWADVLNRLHDDNVVIDGQTAMGRRARAKSKREIDELNAILDRLRVKSKLAKDFYEAFEKARKKLFDIINQVSEENIISDDIRTRLRTYLDQFEKD